MGQLIRYVYPYTSTSTTMAMMVNNIHNIDTPPLLSFPLLFTSDPDPIQHDDV